jgi:hypothetical protein
MYALCIGPITHQTIPALAIDRPAPPGSVSRR